MTSTCPRSQGVRHPAGWVQVQWAGMNLDEIAELLGHKSTRMLQAHYKHSMRATFSGHVEHVDAIFG